MNDERQAYDRLAEGQEAEIKVTVLAVAEAFGGVPVLLAKHEEAQLELWSATPRARCAARSLTCGERVAARITKCASVISDRSYGGLRKQPVARIRFAQLLEFRSAS